MGTHLGIAVPMYGEFYRYDDSQTQVQYVESTGVDNRTFTSPGADNLLALIVTDTSTATSGYLQPFYTSITLTSDAAWSTSNAQINAFATDITLDGTVACEVEGMYVYITNSSGTVTSANISGYVCYIDNLAASATSRAGIQIHVADGNVGSVQDAAVLVRMEGSSCALTNLMQIYCPQYITYFLKTNSAATAGKMIQSKTAAGTQDLVLVCNINGSTYWIPMYAASD